MASFRRSLFPEIWHTPTTDSVHKKKKNNNNNNNKKTKQKRAMSSLTSTLWWYAFSNSGKRMNLLYSNVRLIQPVIIISKWYFFATVVPFSRMEFITIPPRKRRDVLKDTSVSITIHDVRKEISKQFEQLCMPRPKCMQGPTGRPGKSISAPQVMLSQAEQTRDEGGNTTFYCRVKGNPTPAVEWRFKSRKLVSGPKYLIKEGELIVKNLNYSDAGQYTCHARNIFGSSEATGNLSVRGKRSI